MADQIQEDPNAPVWGADEWPRLLENGLDEGDRLHLLGMLELTPMQRLQSLVDTVNSLDKLRQARVRPR
jgi:hypothetical protein